jgi:DNA mismatch repair protein MutH
MNKKTVEEALEIILNDISNKIHKISLDKNKGNVGHYIEEKIGIKKNSDCLDLLDGEIKAFPLKKNKTQENLVPKETIAITMIGDREELKKVKFEESRLCKKTEKIIFIPYLRKGTEVLIFEPVICGNYNENIKNIIKKDFDQIQKKLCDENKIESKIGEYIQSRTKGAKNSKTRAFYFKTKFISEFIINKTVYNDDIKQKIKTVLELE